MSSPVVAIFVMKHITIPSISKLVRDKIPEICSDKFIKFSQIDDDHTYQEFLKAKLLEETKEFITDDSVEELADIVEVIRAILQYKGVKWEDLEEVREKKQLSNGGFTKRILMGKS